jgi:hypothetical protein
MDFNVRPILFPTLDYLKSLPRYRNNDRDNYIEYDWTLLDIIGTNRIRMTYNEDNHKVIIVDLLIDGYTGHYSHTYNLNKSDYKKMKKETNELFRKILNNMNNRYEWSWERPEVDLEE